MHTTWNEDDLQRLVRLAKSELPETGSEDWPSTIWALCDHIRELERDFEMVSNVAQSESQDRQMHQFNANYWEELYRMREDR